MRRRRKSSVPLIVESHPSDYDGYPFITLLQYYENDSELAIIDNTTDKHIKAFVLDLCNPERINEELIVGITSEWYENFSDRYPVSIEFSKRGLSEEVSRISRTYNIDYVTRVIGPLPSFNMTDTIRIRRRRRKTVPEGIEVHKRFSF